MDKEKAPMNGDERMEKLKSHQSRIFNEHENERKRQIEEAIEHNVLYGNSGEKTLLCPNRESKEYIVSDGRGTVFIRMEMNWDKHEDSEYLQKLFDEAFKGFKNRLFYGCNSDK